MLARLKSEIFDVTAYDGAFVGLYDPVFGRVVPGTCPDWFPALTEEVETLALREVRDGEFLTVAGEGLFYGDGGTWTKLERGWRIMRRQSDGQLTVVSPAGFAENFAPA